ncbi:pyrroline-5-carboxylate reductase [Evansella vedderi]|uniref:Pyrroline-5-carboxylate reductase n=1 Tax=Evansella vedderi TaxID=38282 RepID=A0ABT9ZVI5_9BACI|nr:pyrroline-5-carboxylate reductase [Evansella vedderi]MDQ0254960.1 pyrroline-5-carboxylate reductase [Evansella vedderi]
MENTKILMIGAGRMGEAIISGLMKDENGYLGKITVANRSDKERLAVLNELYGIHITDHWQGEVEDHDVIILASPPHTQDEQLNELGKRVDGQLIITVAAGIDPTYMEKRLPEGTPVCWIMPNTAAQIGQSISTYVYGRHVREIHRRKVSVILDAIGFSEELTEDQVHNLTAVTGSAPAFVYTFVEALEGAAVENGVTTDQARILVTKMLLGSAAMLDAGYDPKELISQVASPGGSTAEGIKVLEREKFQEILNKAVRATNQHARSQG